MTSLRRYVRIVPLGLLMGTIFFLSHQPGTELRLVDIPLADKLAHTVAYGLLAAAALYAFTPEKRNDRPLRAALLIILFCTAYGITDEYHQSFIPGREPSPADLAADTTGATLVVSLWFCFRRIRKQRNKRPESERPVRN